MDYTAYGSVHFSIALKCLHTPDRLITVIKATTNSQCWTLYIIKCERLISHLQTPASIQSVNCRNYCKIDVYQVKWPYGPT